MLQDMGNKIMRITSQRRDGVKFKSRFANPMPTKERQTKHAHADRDIKKRQTFLISNEERLNTL